MPPKHRIIIDTDPGVDDVLAILLALSAKSSDLEILLISINFGNVDARACLRNVVAIFNVLNQELAWRQSHNLPLGFESARTYSPLVAVGAEKPLVEEVAGTESADYFHGRDGLAGTHGTHPHFYEKEEHWRHLFEEPPPESMISKTASETTAANSSEGESAAKKLVKFTASLKPAHEVILDLLRSNPPDTITLISIGPLTNFALAAAQDPATFLCAKEVVSMGGAVEAVGNVTPVAEFNVFADPYAAARVYALTSPTPASTIPPVTAGHKLPNYPTNLPRQLNLTLMSLDITESHVLSQPDFDRVTQPLIAAGSPLASWLNAFMPIMFAKSAPGDQHHSAASAASATASTTPAPTSGPVRAVRRQDPSTNPPNPAAPPLTTPSIPHLALHDPMTIFYVLTHPSSHPSSSSFSATTTTTPSPHNTWTISHEDIRPETQGHWTKGQTLRDDRAERRAKGRRRSDGEAPHDRGNWWGSRAGNRVGRVVGSPGGKTEACAEMLLGGFFGEVMGVVSGKGEGEGEGEMGGGLK